MMIDSVDLSFSSALLANIMENSTDMLFIKDLNHVYVGCSRPFTEALKLGMPSDVIGKTDYDLFGDCELTREYIKDDKRAMVSDGPVQCVSKPMRSVDGSVIYASTVKYAIRDAKGKVLGVYGISKDITAQYVQQQSYEQEINYLFNFPHDALAIALFDISDWRIIDIRYKDEETRMISSAQTIGDFCKIVCNSVIEGESTRAFFYQFSRDELLSRYRSGSRQFEFESKRSLRKIGLRWVKNTFHLMANPSNGHVVLFTHLYDIDDEYTAQQALLHAAHYDSLTNILNRDATFKYIVNYLSTTGKRGMHSLLMIDVDNLKEVNDTFGHQAGDHLLESIALKLQSYCPPGSIVGRIGGDEFLVFLKDVSNTEGVGHVAEALVHNLNGIYTKSHVMTSSSVSIGIALVVDSDKRLTELYRQADLALYESKTSGKNTYTFYDIHLESHDGLSPQGFHEEMSSFNLHQLLNNLDAGMTIHHAQSFNRDPVLLFINDSFLHMMGGITRDQALLLYQRNDFSFIHPEDRAMVKSCTIESISGDTQLRIMYRMLGKGGRYYWVSVSYTVCVNDDGSVDIFGVYTNIDSLKQTEEELRQKNRIVEIAMENTDVNICFYDVRTHVCSLSENSGRMHGIEESVISQYPESLVGTGLVHPDSERTLIHMYEQVRKGKTDVCEDIWYRSVNGNGWWCEQTTLTTLFDSSGKPSRVVAIGKDVTAMKNLEAEYQNYLEQQRFHGNAVAYFRINLTENRCIEGSSKLSQHDYDITACSVDLFFDFSLNGILLESDKIAYQEHFNRKKLLESFQNGITTVQLELQHIINADMAHWIATRIEMMRNPSNNCVEARVFVTDIDAEKNLNAMIDRLIHEDYDLLAQVDIRSGAFGLFVEREDDRSVEHDCSQLYYDQAYEKLFLSIINPNFLEEARHAMSRKVVLEELEKTQGSYSVSYPVVGPNLRRKQWRFCYLDDNKAILLITRTDVTDVFALERDPLSGLYNRQTFYRYARHILDTYPDEAFGILRFDIDRFKAFNDAFGSVQGDAVLRQLGRQLKEGFASQTLILGRLEADHFVALVPMEGFDATCWYETISRWLSDCYEGVRLTLSMGVFPIIERDLELSLMCDRALLALNTVKMNSRDKIGWYQEQMRLHMLDEQQMLDDLEAAFLREEFLVYYQPQFNHEDDSLIGAEALVRWKHPQRGLIPPDQFIPLLEKNGNIVRLDEYVWDKTCSFQRRWIDAHEDKPPVPLSVNLSRIDFYDRTLCDRLMNLVSKYGLSPSLLNLEITESAYMQDPSQLIEIVKCLRTKGFSVAMDDFGAGYSALSVLKDVPVDLLKLDMRFLSDSDDYSRVGNILGSVIHMARWLKIPVIAEGVETLEQADYLKSLNCYYMQGYFFSRPVPEDEFLKLLEQGTVSSVDTMEHVDLTGMAAFWDPSVQGTLLFNSNIGGAAIIEYHNGNVQLMRVNDQFYQEHECTRSEFDSVQGSFFDAIDKAKPFFDMVEASISQGGDHECEVRFPSLSGNGTVWVYYRTRLLAINGKHSLLYLSVQDITARKEMEKKLRLNQQELQLTIFHLGGMAARFDIQTRTLEFCEEYATLYDIPQVMHDIPYSANDVYEEDKDVYIDFYERIINGEKNGSAVVRFYSKDGHISSERMDFSTIFSEEGVPIWAVISMRQSQQESSERSVLDNDSACIVEYDTLTDTLVLKARSKEHGITVNSITSWSKNILVSDILYPDDAPALAQVLQDATSKSVDDSIEFRARLFSDDYVRCRLSYSSLIGVEGIAYRIVGRIDRMS